MQCLPAQTESLAIFVAEVLPDSANDLEHTPPNFLGYLQQDFRNLSGVRTYCLPVGMNCCVLKDPKQGENGFISHAAKQGQKVAHHPVQLWTTKSDLCVREQHS